MQAWDFFEVITQKDTWNNYHSFQGRTSACVSATCLLVQLICWRECSCLIQADGSQVPGFTETTLLAVALIYTQIPLFSCSWWGSASPILGFSSWHQWRTYLPCTFQLWFWATIIYRSTYKRTHLEGIFGLQPGSSLLRTKVCIVFVEAWEWLVQKNESPEWI